MSDAKIHYPAADRNKEVIAETLVRFLPSEGSVLEIAAGTGQHCTHFASRFPLLRWQPCDQDEDLFHSLAAYVAEHRAMNPTSRLLDPIRLDVMKNWPTERYDAVLCINMVHIAPIEASEALFSGMEKVLNQNGTLFTYGPYRIDGKHTSESNANFDASLKSRDARWGVRDIDELESMAKKYGMRLHEKVKMPANNYSLVWRWDSSKSF